jgi:hypothetical protein
MLNGLMHHYFVARKLKAARGSHFSRAGANEPVSLILKISGLIYSGA